eukprot:6768649-Pyramimonas_sp.AAC.1
MKPSKHPNGRTARKAAPREAAGACRAAGRAALRQKCTNHIIRYESQINSTALSIFLIGISTASFDAGTTNS